MPIARPADNFSGESDCEPISENYDRSVRSPGSLCVYSAIQVDEVNRTNSSAVPAVVYPYPYEILVLRPDLRNERLQGPVRLIPRAPQ